MAKKKYFTMFTLIMYGDPTKSVVHSKTVATAETNAQAKHLVGLLNAGKEAK